MWFFTPRRLGITTAAWLGSITVNRGRMVQKYGATWLKAKENNRSPTNGMAWDFAYRSTTRLMGVTLDDQVQGVVQASSAQCVRWQGGGGSRGGATATDDNAVQRA